LTRGTCGVESKKAGKMLINGRVTSVPFRGGGGGWPDHTSKKKKDKLGFQCTLKEKKGEKLFSELLMKNGWTPHGPLHATGKAKGVSGKSWIFKRDGFGLTAPREAGSRGVGRRQALQYGDQKRWLSVLGSSLWRAGVSFGPGGGELKSGP